MATVYACNECENSLSLDDQVRENDGNLVCFSCFLEVDGEVTA